MPEQPDAEGGAVRPRRWAVIAHDPQACEWESIATYGFWFRHPKALDADTPTQPPGLEGEADRFARFGTELHVLEADLADCLNEFATAYETLYAPPQFLPSKKFAIVYHIDNFNVRLHKLREDVYRLLALVVGLNHSERPRRGERPWSDQVKDALHRVGLARVGELLRDFEGDPRVRAAMDDRHRFVHQFREEGEKTLEAPERLRLLTAEEDPIARGLRWLVEQERIDRYADGRLADSRAVLDSARELRGRLDFELLRQVAESARRIPAARRRPAHNRLLQGFSARELLENWSPPGSPGGEA